MKRNYFIGLLVMMVFFTGCAPIPKQVTITSVPPGADITVNDTYQGKAPVQITIEQKRSDVDSYMALVEKQYVITAQKQGYFLEEQKVRSSTLVDYTDKPLTIRLSSSPIWEGTTDAVLPNQWHYILVNQYLEPAKTWQRLVDTVTKRYVGIAQLDPESGYIQSDKKEKTFQTVRGTFRLRSEFIAAIEQQKPLKYKMKILSKWSVNGVDWNPYPRVFKEDALLIEEIRDRFAEK